MAAVQAKLSMALTDVDKWCEQAGKYECEVGNLQRNLQQTSDRWQKTAVIQAEQAELVKTQQKVTAYLQSKCAALLSENEALQLQHRQELERRLEALQLQHRQKLKRRLEALQLQHWQELGMSLEALQLQHQ